MQGRLARASAVFQGVVRVLAHLLALTLLGALVLVALVLGALFLGVGGAALAGIAEPLAEVVDSVLKILSGEAEPIRFG